VKGGKGHSKHGLKPNEFNGSGSQSSIFGFNAEAGDCPLFARGPENGGQVGP
jgi:hypothetical protein